MCGSLITQGANESAGLIFAALALVVEGAAFLLPDQISRLCRERAFARALIAVGIWSMTLAFALSNSVGFASLNLADVTEARAKAGSEIALRRADAATGRIGECAKRGPLCRGREADERKASADLAAERSARPDPQIEASAKLISWVFGISPDIAMVRLL
jgi:hypothetical protein